MQAYTGFAAVYDTFMDNIPYEEWCEYADKVSGNGLQELEERPDVRYVTFVFTDDQIVCNDALVV